METLTYTLKKPLVYASQGIEEEAKTLEITAPTNKVIKAVCRLDAQLTKALTGLLNQNFFKDSKEEGKKELDSKDYLFLLGSGGADLDKCYDDLKVILRHTCKIDGKENMTDILFDRMEYSETKNLLGEYLKFFLGSSLQT